MLAAINLIEFVDWCFKEFHNWRDDADWDVFRLDEANVQLMIVYFRESKQPMVIFRGTDSPEDVITSVNIFQRKLVLPYAGMERSDVRVHSGFIRDWKKVRQIVIAYLLYKYETLPAESFVFIGHSLGGALAQLASLDFQYHMETLDNPVDISCFTFGSPRVGNAGFRRSRDKRVSNTLNIVNENDPVFYSPWYILGYRRSGQVLQVGKKSYFWLPFYFRIKSHLLSEYRYNIERFTYDD